VFEVRNTLPRVRSVLLRRQSSGIEVRRGLVVGLVVEKEDLLSVCVYYCSTYYKAVWVCVRESVVLTIVL
jgi:hypothetical protein